MIRKATLSDIDAVYEMCRSLFDDFWSRASFEAEFYKDYSHQYICIEDDIILGFILFWHIEDDSTLMLVATVKSAQKKGVATKLIDYMFKNFPSKKWFLEVDKNNIAAVNFYIKNGFKRLSDIKNYYGIGIDAMRMGRIDID